jgi:hypothetical protein
MRIEAALSGNDLHASEVEGLISAADAAAARLENLIEKLHILLTAVVAEKAAQKPKQKPQNVFTNTDDFWASEPDHRSRQAEKAPVHHGFSGPLRPRRAEKAVQKKPQPRVKSYVVGSLQDPNAPF